MIQEKVRALLKMAEIEKQIHFEESDPENNQGIYQKKIFFTSNKANSDFENIICYYFFLNLLRKKIHH